MQLENAAEWALREKLETEKLSLERENRRLKSEIIHVTEELTKNRLSNATNSLDASVSLLQEEINEKNKVSLNCFIYYASITFFIRISKFKEDYL